MVFTGSVINADTFVFRNEGVVCKQTFSKTEELAFTSERYQPHPDCFLQQPFYLSKIRDFIKYVSMPIPEVLTVIGPATRQEKHT